MNFIDVTGHIFSLPTYDDDPLHLKYKEGEYIFWLKDKEISINNYYILPIRFIINVNDISLKDSTDKSYDEPFKININIESNFYKLIGPKYIQEKIESCESIKESILINFDEAKDELTLDDFYFDVENSSQNLIVESGTEKYYMFPFYVIGKSEIEGTLLSNIMIQTGYYKEFLNEEKVVWLDRDQMYDYLIKQTISDIKIYEFNPDTEEKTLWYTIRTGYNLSTTEIITPDDIDYCYRIRNWGQGIMRPNVYHYIYKIPQEKWLLKDHYYCFEGKMNETCHYCGSVVYANHDGYGDSIDGAYNNPTENSLIDVRTGRPFYPEDYNYDEETDTWTPKSKEEQTKIMHLSGDVLTSHNYGDSCEFVKTSIVHLNNTIKDIWFDIDNEKVTNNKDGGYVTIRSFKYLNQYTPITVGATFIDEQEELIINGKNMGIHLPKEIIRSIYSAPFYHKYADEKLFKDKMKELLLNYMSIKGECGNFKSVLNSLKWFGWGDKIEISKLIKTDNEFQNQFILDYFSITTDLKEIYKFFNPTNMISLSIKGNIETGEIDRQDYNQSLIGEGKPLLKDLFDEVVEVNDNGLSFYKPYYNFIFTELAIKLDCLKYYYQQYFLPIHIKINRASIDYKVYANTVKMTSIAIQKQADPPIFVPNQNIKVIFPESHKLLYYKSEHYIDNKFNEFNNYKEGYEREDLFYLNENCIIIPLNFVDLNNKYYKDNKGDYFLIDGEYIKPYKFLNEAGKVVESSKASYYILNKGEIGQKIEDIERYYKVTNEYFNCKIFITYTIKNQSDKGHYCLIDGEYLYKEKFYNDLGDEDENGSYIYLWGNSSTLDKLTYIPKENRYDITTENLLDFDNSFQYYQDYDNQYLNFILIPRLLKNKNIDWLNTDFRMSVLVNNTWFTYDFNIDIPNLYLEFGKLEYRYFVGGEFTMFDQIEDLDDNHLTLKSFMYQPDFVSINSLFYDEKNNTSKTFVEKLYEIEEGVDEEDYVNMHNFYQEYYKNKITIPYNKLYYNRIHLFDIYENSYYSSNNRITYDEGHPFKTWQFIPNYLNSGMNKLDYMFSLCGYDTVGRTSYSSYISAKEIENNSHQITDEERELIANGTLSDNYPYDPNKPMQIEYCYIGYGQDGDRPTYFVILLSVKMYNQDNELIYHYRLDDTDTNFFTNIWSDKIKSEKGVDNANDLILEKEEDLYDYNMLGQEEPVKLKYDGNPINIELYKTFFKKSGDGYVLNTNINENVPYDAYLMHDDINIKNPCWYIVFISKYPIGVYSDENDLDIKTGEYIIKNSENNKEYIIKYYGTSIDKFLINRMDIVRSNGYNHFNKNDLVIVNVRNNDYQFNIDLTNKWDISLIWDNSNANKVKSNSNIMIIPTNNVDHLYTPGYYNVLLNYSINGLNDHNYLTKGYYRINDINEEIIYPDYIEDIEEDETFDINYVISDFSIVYENDNGERISSRDILDPSEGYKPFGLKILNKGYFNDDQKWSIYMGLKALDCNHPDTGFSDYGRNGILTPWWGFYGEDLEGLKSFDVICYGDTTRTTQLDYVYFPSDNAPLDEEGNFKYPCGNNGRRGYSVSPRSSCVNILNDDDTINWDYINKETHAAGDWNGYENTQIILNNMDAPSMSDWRTRETFPQGLSGVLEPNMKFSPLAACAWRYHTTSTNQGDWYIPSYAELIFITYNFKKLNEKFEEIKSLYPECCKADLFSGLSGNAVWSSTECSRNLAWELHPGQYAHALAKSTLSWWGVPYIRLDDTTLNVYSQ